MFYNKPTIILRHKKENKNKCSLKGLETNSNFTFYTYPKDALPNLAGYILLDLDASPLTKDDKDKGLFILDGTWKLASTMAKFLPESIEKRSIPKNYKTAYPRKQTHCADPNLGLASIEAIYLAYLILDKDPKGLLDNYYWKTPFLEKNNL